MAAIMPRLTRGCFHKLGVRFLGVLYGRRHTIRGLYQGTDFWKLPCDLIEDFRNMKARLCWFRLGTLADLNLPCRRLRREMDPRLQGCAAKQEPARLQEPGKKSWSEMSWCCKQRSESCRGAPWGISLSEGVSELHKAHHGASVFGRSRGHHPRLCTQPPDLSRRLPIWLLPRDG